MPIDLKDVLEALPDGVIVIDAGGHVVDSNGEACRILERSAETLAGMPLAEALEAFEPMATQVAAALLDGTAMIAREIGIQSRSGRRSTLDIAVSPLAGGPEGAVITLRDQTVSSELQHLAAQRDRLQAFGHIAAGIAHEVKNPLGGIRGAAELLGQWSSEERSRDAASLIVGEVDRIRALVDELMVFAREDQIALEKLNIHWVLDSVLDLLSVDPLAKSVEIERLYDPSLPEFRGDPDRLKQVFLNLGRNALQAMEGPGSRLRVITKMHLGRRALDADGRPIPAIDILFADTGPGIDAATLAQIATPLFTTRAKGHGLGLAVARHWLMRHAGSLEIESEPGSGTTVTATLPLRRLEPGIVKGASQEVPDAPTPLPSLESKRS